MAETGGYGYLGGLIGPNGPYWFKDGRRRNWWVPKDAGITSSELDRVRRLNRELDQVWDKWREAMKEEVLAARNEPVQPGVLDRLRQERQKRVEEAWKGYREYGKNKGEGRDKVDKP